MSAAQTLAQLSSEMGRLGFAVVDADSGTPPSSARASVVGFTASSEGLPRDISGRRRHFLNITVEVLLPVAKGQQVERLFKAYDTITAGLRSTPPVREFVVRGANVVQRAGNEALSVIIEASYDQ